MDAFKKAGITPNIVFGAMDADVLVGASHAPVPRLEIHFH